MPDASISGLPDNHLENVCFFLFAFVNTRSRFLLWWKFLNCAKDWSNASGCSGIMYDSDATPL